MMSTGQGTSPDSAAKPEAHIVMEIVGDKESAGWCIVREGEAVHTGTTEGGFPEAVKTAVTQLINIDDFRNTTTYVGHRKIRMLLNDVYPNVVRSPNEACVPPQDVRLARRSAMKALNNMIDRNQQLEQKRERRRSESKRKRYVENRLMARLKVAAAASLPSRDTVAGIAWLAEDGRHAVRPINVHPGDKRLAELWALAYLLKAFNSGRLLTITMGSKNSANLFLNRHHMIAKPEVYPADLIEVLLVLDEYVRDRDVILTDETGPVDPLSRTAHQLAEFARKLHHSGGETPEQWAEIDAILLHGIGYDRKAARKT